MGLPSEQAANPWEIAIEPPAQEQPKPPEALGARVEFLSGRVAEFRELLVAAHDQLLLRDEEIASLHELAAQRDQIRRVQSTWIWRLGARYGRTRDRLLATICSRVDGRDARRAHARPRDQLLAIVCSRMGR